MIMDISYLEQLVGIPHSSGDALQGHVYPGYGRALEQVRLIHAENGQ